MRYIRKCVWCDRIEGKYECDDECSAPDGDGHLWALYDTEERKFVYRKGGFLTTEGQLISG